MENINKLYTKEKIEMQVDIYTYESIYCKTEYSLRIVISQNETI